MKGKNMDKQVYNDLCVLRQHLKKFYSVNGKVPTICSDETLKEMATLLPRKKDDLYAISGVGNSFVEKYGDSFMYYFDDFHNNKNKSMDTPIEVKDTLKRLESRLINISKKNKLLYNAKSQTYFSMDLFEKNNLEKIKASAILFLGM